MTHHLVIVKRLYLEAILAGHKRIESRFLRSRGHAFGKVQAGDKLFLKVSSGPVCGTATVLTVRNFENLTPRRMLELKRRYNSEIGGSDEYWVSKKDCKFGFLVWLKDAKPIKPIWINKKDWRAWVVLTAKENYGLLGRELG